MIKRVPSARFGQFIVRLTAATGNAKAFTGCCVKMGIEMGNDRD
ncbi:MAG: hypothetical protein ACI4DU_08150 [Lachnospiraceae bacterium]